jgi:GH43 family beta-xylosidase
VEFRNPVIRGDAGADHGDPFIIRYLDRYFLYHTGETAGRRGIHVYESVDLVRWTPRGVALEAAPAGWSWSDLWAPEVVYERGVFYMFVAATRQREGREPLGWEPGPGDDLGRRIGLAVSDDPVGPFRWAERPMVDQWAIDAHPFRDDDGAMWLFYNVRTEETRYRDGSAGTGNVVDRLVTMERLAGEPVPVTVPSERWEGNRAGTWYWNEAPYVVKRRDRYFQMYSGGAYHEDTYGIGLAHAADVRGPWTKYARNPILRGTAAIAGPGHHSLIYGPDVATRYAVYHGYVPEDTGRKVHLDRLLWGGERPVVAGPTSGAQPAPPPPAYDLRLPHWRAEAWARGDRVDVQEMPFALDPPGVWHQVEAARTGGRLEVRVGGVLRYLGPARGEPCFAGDVRAITVSSYLEDAGMTVLPPTATREWGWTGPGEVTLAVSGRVRVATGDDVHDVGTDAGRWTIVTATAPALERIAVTAVGDGARVTDVFVYRRPGARAGFGVQAV